jgi:septum formation protein
MNDVIIEAQKDDFKSVIVIGADTVVTHKNIIYGKPTDDQHAIEMLQKFSGQSHQVFTGVAILTTTKLPVVFYEATQVTFDAISDDVIRAYVATGEPSDKAGGK